MAAGLKADTAQWRVGLAGLPFGQARGCGTALRRHVVPEWERALQPCADEVKQYCVPD
jgi:hypothetical protein